VWALKIKEIWDRAPDGETIEPGAALIVPAEDWFSPIVVNADYMRKHNPQPGGYWVQYQDGYESWWPAEAFESGYTLNSSEEIDLKEVLDKEHIMQFFENDHLPYEQRFVSALFAVLATKLVTELPRNPERTVALRKLLEAKDAAVRASLAK
jgi:hypothetical protein